MDAVKDGFITRVELIGLEASAVRKAAKRMVALAERHSPEWEKVDMRDAQVLRDLIKTLKGL